MIPSTSRRKAEIRPEITPVEFLINKFVLNTVLSRGFLVKSKLIRIFMVDRVAQSVFRLTRGWKLQDGKKNPGGDEIFRPSRPALGPTESPVQWVPGLLPGVNCGRGVLLTTHPLPVPRSWKIRAIPLLTLWATPGL